MQMKRWVAAFLTMLLLTLCACDTEKPAAPLQTQQNQTAMRTDLSEPLDAEALAETIPEALGEDTDSSSANAPDAPQPTPEEPETDAAEDTAPNAPGENTPTEDMPETPNDPTQAEDPQEPATPAQPVLPDGPEQSEQPSMPEESENTGDEVSNPTLPVPSKPSAPSREEAQPTDTAADNTQEPSEAPQTEPEHEKQNQISAEASAETESSNAAANAETEKGADAQQQPEDTKSQLGEIPTEPSDETTTQTDAPLSEPEDELSSEQTDEPSENQPDEPEDDWKTSKRSGAGWQIAFAAAALLAAVESAYIWLRREREKKWCSRKETVCTTQLPRTQDTPFPDAAGNMVNRVAIGKVHAQGARESQQDSFSVSSETLHPGGLLAIVADGMGGLSDGDKVSQTIVSTVMHAYVSREEAAAPRLPALLAKAKLAVDRLLGPDGIRQSGATVVIGMIRDGLFEYLSVGDSRICLWRDGELHQLNRSHSYSQELLIEAINGKKTFAEIEKRNV